MGHDFDDDLVCECSVSFDAHQVSPHPCPRVTRRYKRTSKPGTTRLNAMRQALGLPVQFVADQCGVSRETARRALHGMTHGKHLTSQATTDMVCQFVRDLSEASHGR